MTRARRFRWAWWLLAYTSLGVGMIGIFVPGLPTTVFVLVAAWAAARGSQRLHRRLHAHPRFGPAIRDWETQGAVPRAAKRAASGSMLVCAIVLVAVMAVFPAHRWWMTALPIACMAVVAAWLWRRPEPVADRRGGDDAADAGDGREGTAREDRHAADGHGAAPHGVGGPSPCPDNWRRTLPTPPDSDAPQPATSDIDNPE